MTERTYVALDLETTGLDPKRDAIIEIGAVRFQGRQMLERFHTLVNPQRAIPLRVQQITGIRNADVTTAPPLARVVPELLAFVHSEVAAVVAHNAGFDLSFLQTAGIQFHRPALDTFELATILLPNQASYNLGELCRTLQIDLPNAHRALGDAAATAHLFMALQQQAAALPPVLRQMIVESGQYSDWPLLALFEDAHLTPFPAHREKPAIGIGQTHDGDRDAPLSSPTQWAVGQPVADDEIERFFATDGVLAQQMGSAYEVRVGQVEMARQVTAALNTGNHLLIEAGTGTGKTLAYLVPTALWSVANQERVVIATNTIPLQDQLLSKDIPQVQALLAAVGKTTPRTALLKGRTNYLCTRRLHTWRTSHRLTASEVSLLAKVLVWLSTTRTGDVNELLLTSSEDRALWARLCSDAATCTPARCGLHIRPDPHGLPRGDFFHTARQQAEEAHLLVVNHALLLADIASGGHVLPAYSNLIVDEAHHLEEVTSEQLTSRIDWRWVRTLLQRLTANEELLFTVAQQAERQQLAEVAALAQNVKRNAERAIRENSEFADQLLQFALGVESSRQETGYTQRIALDSRLRAQPLWSQLEVEWEKASEAWRSVVNRLTALLQSLAGVPWHSVEPGATLRTEVQAVYDQLAELLAQADVILFEPKGPDGLVKWLEISEKSDTVSLVAAPLYVNEILQQALIEQRRSVILTSATLRTNAGFDFIRQRLGLWDVHAVTVESPFDYQASTLLLLPSNLPAPNHAEYQRAVEKAIVEAASAAEGRTLVLFTSHAHLRTTADAIRAPLDRLNITVLQHGASGRNRLLREYRQAERAVLLGTRSFWEGIDLPGDELCCLLIVRLPFSVPSDPLVAARTADLEDAFHEYTLPDAILRFRQGFGRLIRRATDRGAVVVLDNRVWQKEYGRAFLDALPTCTVRRSALTNIGDEIREWLS